DCPSAGRVQPKPKKAPIRICARVIVLLVARPDSASHPVGLALVRAQHSPRRDLGGKGVA
ncbi:MAG TPA: hypothetical protein VFD71_17870, partial [Planctomycetota bacterium]|nr:hypothetical protein [Planctomycetota bacterium]